MYHSKQTEKFRNKIRPWQLKPVRAPCQQSLAFGYSTSAEVRVAATSKDWLDLDRASISPPRSRRRQTEAVFAGCCQRRYKGYYMPLVDTNFIFECSTRYWLLTSAQVRVAATSKDWLDSDRASIYPPRSRRRQQEAVLAGYCQKDMKDITCPLVDTNFIFEFSTRYLTSKRSECSVYYIDTDGEMLWCFFPVGWDWSCHDSRDTFTCEG